LEQGPSSCLQVVPQVAAPRGLAAEAVLRSHQSLSWSRISPTLYRTRVQKSPPLVSPRSQMNPNLSYFSEVNFNIISHPCAGLGSPYAASRKFDCL
jgi:hypothetical protein